MLGSFIVAAALAVAQPVAAEDAGRQVARLVRQLDAPVIAQRVAAEEALVELGPAALEHLPAITVRTSAETRQRLTRIRQRLEQRQAEQSASGSKVTLQGEMLLSEALAAIEKQTGNRIVDLRREFGGEPDTAKLKLDLESVDFWPALDQLLDQAELGIYSYANDGQLAIVERSAGQVDRGAHAAYASPFRIEATSVHAQRDLRQPGASSLNLSLEVAWEPRLEPIIVQQSFADLELRDNGGEPLALLSSQGAIEAQVSGGASATTLLIPLKPASPQATSIASLRGRLVALLPGKVEPFTFDNLTKIKDAEQRHGAAVVSLTQTRKNRDVWEVFVRIRFDNPGNALESHRGWIFANPAYLLDKQGERVEPAGYETTRHSTEEVGLTYLFDVKELGDYQFVYETPTALVPLSLEYELKDLPLP